MIRKTLFTLILAALVAAPAFAGDWMAVGDVVSIRGEITASGVSFTSVLIEDGAGTGQYAIQCPPANVQPNACLGLDPGHTYEMRGRIVPQAGSGVTLLLETATPTVNVIPSP